MQALTVLGAIGDPAKAVDSASARIKGLEAGINKPMKSALRCVLGIGIGVLMMTALTASAFASDTSNDTTRARYKIRRVDGLNIFYREAGSPSQPTIVLLHGFPSSLICIAT